MAQIEYRSELVIVTGQKAAGQAEGKTETLNIPVHSFEVEGGANRKIEMASLNEMVIGLEFEQARIYTNFIFYIPPTKDFLIDKLINLSKPEKKGFSLSFAVGVYSEGRIVRQIEMVSDGASFQTVPIMTGGSPPLMKAQVRLKSPELFYGQGNPNRVMLILKKI